MPGLTSKIPIFSLIRVSSFWLSNPGLGPTKLISPFNTFHSCGSSSSLDVRSIAPNFVVAVLSMRCVGRDSVPFHCSNL